MLPGSWDGVQESENQGPLYDESLGKALVSPQDGFCLNRWQGGGSPWVTAAEAPLFMPGGGPSFPAANAAAALGRPSINLCTWPLSLVTKLRPPNLLQMRQPAARHALDSHSTGDVGREPAQGRHQARKTWPLTNDGPRPGFQTDSAPTATQRDTGHRALRNPHIRPWCFLD